MPKKAVQQAVEAWILEFRNGTSDKFYAIYVTEAGVTVLRWGRRGTAGQSSANAYKNYDDARDQGLKQVFAKKSKGYSQIHEGKFLVDVSIIEAALRGDAYSLHLKWQEAMNKGEFEGTKQTVLKNYADFAERVQRLLARAEDSSFEELNREFEAIEEVWAEISDRHGEVSAALNLAKVTLFQRMMQGTA